MEKEFLRLIAAAVREGQQAIFARIQDVTSQVGDLVADRVNEAYGNAYSSLPSLLKVLSGPCLDQGVTFKQEVEYPADGAPVLRTTVMCAEDPLDSTDLRIPLAGANWDDPQSWGAALTYVRRISLQTIFNLAAAEDDDANAISPVEEKVTEQAKKRATRSRAKRSEELQEQAVKASEQAPTLKEKDFETMLASLRVSGTEDEAENEALMIKENFVLSEDQQVALQEALSQTVKNLSSGK